MTGRFVIFGATGDLTGRYLLRALAELEAAAVLAPDLEIIGVARDQWDSVRFREHASSQLATHAPDVDASARSSIVRRLAFVAGDVTDVTTIAAATAGTTEPLLIYFALPPSVFPPVIVGLGAVGLPEGSCIVVEKPFGTDLESAESLNELLAQHVPASSVFRMDHFLGKQTVQNILGLRFANRMFEPLWCAEHIDHVEVVWDETVALEGRAGYYDHTGALLDMVQNHLLQLVALIAMERPSSLGERSLRDAKVSALRAVRTARDGGVVSGAVRARYTTGTSNGVTIADYVREDGVDPARETETFAEVTLYVDTERWLGVPFRLRTGKALREARREVRLHLKPTNMLPFGQVHEPGPNVITMSMDPDVLTADIALNGAGDPFDLEPTRWKLELAPQALSAYARLLLDAIGGDLSLSIRGDETEECWRIVEPIAAHWRSGSQTMHEYPAGSNGPTGVGSLHS